MSLSFRQSSRSESAVSVTSAAEPRSVDILRRQRRYTLAMSLRVLCFVGMLALPLPLAGRLALAAVAIVIPYVAVVAANVWAPTRGPVTPPRHDPRALTN